MTTIQERYKRVYDFLATELDEWSAEELDLLRNEGMDLMYLRNETGLWEDYEEDETMIIDGCNQDPNHPDNLSHAVWKSFALCHLGWDV